MRLTMTSDEALGAPRKQARRGQPETSESSSSGDEVDISFIVEPCQPSSNKETSMPYTWPTLDPGSEEAMNGAGL
jgi:hypothetical protein